MESQLITCDEEEKLASHGGPVFNPPVYKQRYQAVLDLARKLQPKKVVDMGCGECKLLRLLKLEHYIEELYGVDVEGSLLERSQYLITPLTTDYIHKRPLPLHIFLMKGSISKPDQRIQNCDFLAFIEVIEHLHFPDLERVPQSLFGDLHPKTVIISTPNADFNILFGPTFTGFRHFDHKFEWTRKEFQSWCLKVCVTYGYIVEFNGVGDPELPQDYHLGHCSQIAVFSRRASVVSNTNQAKLDTTYEIVAECAHPYEESLITAEEKLCREAEYYINVILRRNATDSKDEEEEEEEESDKVVINLKDLLMFPQIRRLCSSTEEIRSSLQTYSNSQLLVKGDKVYVESDYDSIHSSGSDHETSSELQTISHNCNEPPESWD